MKFTQIITGCALAAGLMVVASNQAQAGVVIGNQLFAPANVKAKITYLDNGKYKQMSFSNKDVLSNSGYDDKGNSLAVGENGDVYVINQHDEDVVADLNTEGYVESYWDEYLYTEKETKNGYDWKSQGYADLYFYDNNIEGDGNSYVNIYGNYKEKGSYSENKKNISESWSAKLQNAPAEAYDYSSGDYMPGSGSLSASGDGKLDYVD